MASMPERERTSGDLDEVMASARAAVAEQPRDPLVPVLIITIGLIVVLTLVTVAYALLTDVFGTGAPRNFAEKRLMGAQAAVDAGSKDPQEWMTYIMALTDDRQYDKAQEVINKGKKTLKDQDISADMVYMQANLYFAQGKLDKALETANVASKTIMDRYKVGEEATKAGKMDKAFAFGVNDNYFNVLLLKAEIYEKKKAWKDALKAYDEYLATKKQAATVFAQRGAVKEKLGDKAGAAADYRQTVMFIPQNADALAGLKRIGAAK